MLKLSIWKKQTDYLQGITVTFIFYYFGSVLAFCIIIFFRYHGDIASFFAIVILSFCRTFRSHHESLSLCSKSIVLNLLMKFHTMKFLSKKLYVLVLSKNVMIFFFISIKFDNSFPSHHILNLQENISLSNLQ